MLFQVCSSSGRWESIEDVEVTDELGSTYPFLANRGAISADDELLCGRGEVGQPTDGEIFVVHAGVVMDGVISLEEELSQSPGKRKKKPGLSPIAECINL